MVLKLQSNNLSDYLQHTKIIDFDNNEIITLAKKLNNIDMSKLDLIKTIYEFVRDEINHSADIKAQKITCIASEVLVAKEGLCYAKSHLLAALLRYNSIPCGFCYQLLQFNAMEGLVLHGLNAVYLEDCNKWIRLDARGNKKGINSQFSIDNEQLSYPVRINKGELDIPIVFTEPDLNIIYTLSYWKNFDELWANLPSILNYAV